MRRSPRSGLNLFFADTAVVVVVVWVSGITTRPKHCSPSTNVSITKSSPEQNTWPSEIKWSVECRAEDEVQKLDFFSAINNVTALLKNSIFFSRGSIHGYFLGGSAASPRLRRGDAASPRRRRGAAAAKPRRSSSSDVNSRFLIRFYERINFAVSSVKASHSAFLNRVGIIRSGHPRTFAIKGGSAT